MAGSTAARYVRGGWTALVTEQGVALLHPSIGEERVRGVWSALNEGAGVSGCLEVLAADGLVGLPSFALVQHGQGELRVLVRGEVQVSAGEQEVGASGIATWREALVSAETYRVFVADDDAAGVAWPLSAGIVLASAVEWLGAVPEVTGAAQAGIQAAETAQEQAEEDEPATDSGVAQTEVSPAVELSDEDEIAAVADDGLQAAAESGEPVEAPDAAAEENPVEEEQPEGDVAAAAEESPDEEEEPEAGAAPVSEETQVGELPERQATHPAPSLAAEGSEIIDSLPWAVSTADREQAAAAAPGSEPDAAAPTPPAASTGADSGTGAPAAEAPQPPAPEPAADDLPEHTVLSPHGPNAAAAAAAASGPVPPWQPPSDMSAPSGGAPAYGQGDVDIDGDHDGHTIMVSELPKDQDMTIVPGLGDTDLYDEPGQPPAGAPVLSLSVSTGAEVPLDRPVLIGRAPESARFSAGVQPRLVTVPSPQQDISRTHVEIRAEGGSAVVTDLNSTNGTVLVQPSAAPRRLHAGEGASVPAGTLIDLGDGVTVNVHPTDQAGT